MKLIGYLVPSRIALLDSKLIIILKNISYINIHQIMKLIGHLVLLRIVFLDSKLIVILKGI